MAKDTIKKQCRALWEKARTTPVTLQFTSKPEMDRAGFTLYSACPKQERTELELTKDRRKFTITIQRKELNTYHETFKEELEKALGGRTAELDKEYGVTDEEIEESVRRMQDKLDYNSGKEMEERPANPYFNREEN